MTKINKEGWEIKKLGEVCEIKSGFTPKSNELYSEGLFPYYKVADMNTPGNEVYLDATISYLHETKKYYKKGAIVFPKNGAAVSTNKKRILKHDSIVDLNTAIATFTEKTYSSYAYYWFLHTDFRNYVRGGALPTLDIKSLKDRKFPLPPLPIQQRIVEELEEINAIISAKKQQLSKLDELAQSIFYNMFGDPVANEKGWEVKTFKQCFSLKSGDGLSAKNFVDGQYPVYGGNGIAGYHNAFNKEGQNIIIGRVGALCGNVHLVEGQIFVTDNAFVLSTNENFEATTLLYLLRFLNLRQFARDALQPVISNTSLKDIKVILPPLSLQEAFATRVSAIEDQKAAIAASIEKMQTLLDARMQEYFG